MLDALRTRVPGHCNGDLPDLNTVNKVVRSPESWLLTSTDLEVIFNSEKDLDLCYGVCVSNITIARPDLSNFMISGALASKW